MIIPYAIPPSVTTKESPAEHSSCFIQMIAHITRALSLLITSQQRNASKEMMGWVQMGAFKQEQALSTPWFGDVLWWKCLTRAMVADG